jgi:hypothetical protein
LFIYRVRVQHWTSAAACGCWSTLFLRHKTVSTEGAQHTEIHLPRDKKPLRFGSTRSKFTRGNMVSTLRGKTTNIAWRGSRAQSIHGFNTVMTFWIPSKRGRFMIIRLIINFSITLVHGARPFKCTSAIYGPR